jgi:hypothetical protein
VVVLQFVVNTNFRKNVYGIFDCKVKKKQRMICVNGPKHRLILEVGG